MKVDVGVVGLGRWGRRAVPSARGVSKLFHRSRTFSRGHDRALPIWKGRPFGSVISNIPSMCRWRAGPIGNLGRAAAAVRRERVNEDGGAGNSASPAESSSTDRWRRAGLHGLAHEVLDASRRCRVAIRSSCLPGRATWPSGSRMAGSCGRNCQTGCISILRAGWRETALRDRV